MSIQWPNGIYGEFSCNEDALSKINENFKKLDFSLGATILGTVAALPALAATGQAYILSTTGEVWVYEDKWVNYGASKGQIVYDQENESLIFYDGTQWLDVSSGAGASVTSESVSKIARFGSSTTSIFNGVETQIRFTNELETDTHVLANTNKDEFLIQEDGKYRVEFTGSIAQGSAIRTFLNVRFIIKVNDVEVSTKLTSWSESDEMSFGTYIDPSYTFTAQAGDLIKVFVMQFNSGASGVSLTNTDAHTNLTISRFG